MRDDFAERFSEPTERPKNRGKFPRRQKKVARRDEDGHPPEFKGMRKVHLAVGDGWYRHGGSDYSILERFLRSRCGQKWDDVYSEICQQADARTHDGHRLRESVGNIVATRTEVGDDGRVYQKDKWGREHVGWWHEFYVHPETGLLEFMPRQRYRYDERKQFPPKVYEVDGRLYHQHAGLWYKVEMRPVPTEPSKWGGGHWTYSRWASFTDAFGAHESPKPPKAQPGTYAPYYSALDRIKRKYGLGPGGQAWYCFSKQSAGSREIEKVKNKLAELE